MKKVWVIAAAAGMGLMLTGCLGPKANNDGFPSVPSGLLFSDMQSAQMVQQKILPAQQKYTVLKRVSAEATTASYIGLVSAGDSSFSLLKSKALADCREADDIIDLEVDFYHSNILGIVNKVTTTIRGVAIKYNK